MEQMRIAAVSTRNWIGEPVKSIANMKRWCRRAADQGAEFVLFPELGVSGYIQNEVAWDLAETIPGPSTDRLADIAKELGQILCFGLLERDADITYNTQVLVGEKGPIGKQRKVHMPGTEYLYWRGGFSVSVFDIGKARVGISICYDSLFAELTRSFYFKGAEILIMPFAYDTKKVPRSRFPEDHITGLCYRTHCYENGLYGIVCNNAGTRKKSRWEPKGCRFPGWAGVFDPRGDVAAFTRERGNGEAMVVADLDPRILEERRRSPYFIPRSLRPEMYTHIQDSERSDTLPPEIG